MKQKFVKPFASSLFKTLTMLIAITTAEPSFAGNENPNIVPLGDREAFLGNTGVALVGSPAAGYYNPAGLASARGLRFSASGTTYGIVEQTIGTGNEPLAFRSFTAVPNMVVSSREIKDWVFSLSVFVPVVLEVNSKFDLNLEEINASATVALHNKVEENLVGLSAARAASEKWAIGVSAFLLRTNQISLTSNQLENGDSTLHLAQSKQLTIVTSSLNFVFGAQHQLTDDFRWGLRLQTPSIKLAGSGHIYDEKLIVSGGAPTREITDEDYDANSPSPSDMQLGLSWRLASRYRWLLDLGVSGPLNYESVPGSTENQITELGLTVRGNTGLSYSINETLKMLVGVQWNPSTINSRVASEPSSKTNFLGVSGGVYFEEDRINSGIGAFYLKSRPDTAFFSGTPDDPTGLEVYGLILSSSIKF